MIFVKFDFVALLCYYNCGVILIGGLMNKKTIKILLLIWLLLIPYITNIFMYIPFNGHYLDFEYTFIIYLSMLITVLILYYEVSKKK